MEIKTFKDAHQREIEVHVNMGREVSIYQKYPEIGNQSCDSSIGLLPLTVLQDILIFCEECQQKLQKTASGTKVTEHGITFLHGDMEIKTTFDLQFVTIANSFPDMDSTTFRSRINHLLLASLKEAVAFGKQCQQEFLHMLEQARAKETLPLIADAHVSQDETLSF